MSGQMRREENHVLRCALSPLGAPDPAHVKVERRRSGATPGGVARSLYCSRAPGLSPPLFVWSLNPSSFSGFSVAISPLNASLAVHTGGRSTPGDGPHRCTSPRSPRSSVSPARFIQEEMFPARREKNIKG